MNVFAYFSKINKSWLIINPKVERNRIKYFFKNADILISDIDDTDAPSPARYLARYGYLKPRFFLNVRYQSWCFSAFIEFLKHGKKAESKKWKEYIELFLRNETTRKSLLKRVDLAFLKEKQYPGVKEFYEMWPDLRKIYITRNIKEVASLFQKNNNFDEVYWEKFNKIDSVKEVLKNYPEIQNVILKGDSEEDLELLSFLKKLKDEKKLIGILSIWVAPSMRKAREEFDINISRNYDALNRFLKDI